MCVWCVCVCGGGGEGQYLLCKVFVVYVFWFRRISSKVGSECDHLPEAGNNYLGSECDHQPETGNKYRFSPRRAYLGNVAKLIRRKRISLKRVKHPS
jgi:hypothetical protein